MTGETKQRRQNEHYRQRNEINARLGRHQQIHRHRAEAEIDHADQDLQQRQPRRGQHHLPAVLTELAAVLAHHQPDEIGRNAGEAAERDQPVHRRRQKVHRGGGPGVPRHAEAEHEQIAEPEGQP